MKALIVEDDSRIAQAMAGWLASAGCDVTITHSLQDAERLLQHDSVNVITLDLGLSDSSFENTIERIETIRKHRPEAILIVVSGIATLEDERDFKKRGADALIEKVEIPTERTFLGRLQDIAHSIMGRKHDFTKNTANLEKFARLAAKRCNELGCGLSDRLANKR